MTDLRQDHNPDHPLTKALRETVVNNKLSGGVMLTLDGERVGVNSSSPDDEFGKIMTRLGDAILFAFDSGEFDHCLNDKH